jgi:hypothetical protein
LSTFISYSRADSAFAVRLAKDLRSAGYDIWLDQLDIATGSRWDDEVEFALENCKTFMIILSPESLQSQNVKDEIGYAIDAGKEILPVKIKSGEIPFRLRRFQYVDFSQRPYADSLEEIKSILPKGHNSMSTMQIEKRLVGEELQSMVEELEAQKAGSVAQPDQPRASRMEAIDSPANKRPGAAGLLIALVAVVGLVAAGFLFSNLRVRESAPTAAPTMLPTIENPPTEKPTAKPTVDMSQVALTQGVPSESFVMKFSESTGLDDWEQVVKGTGRASKITVSPADDGLLFDLNDADLRAFYFYKPDVYEDVAIRWKAENVGKSNYIVGLVCRRSGDSWYEFRVTGDGLWSLQKYHSTYLTLDSGGAKNLNVGKGLNEYEMLCDGHVITLRINGETVTKFDFKTSYYTQGQVGFTIASRQDIFPIDIKSIQFEVSKPAPG